jgi:5'-deoxy-5'-methylthioadenosine phosphorylase
MTKLAIIGGTGINLIENMDVFEKKTLDSSVYGETSAELIVGSYAKTDFIFLARHGNPHTIPPHKINYRANIWALKECGIERIISINAVGGITSKMKPTRIIIPDQIIDYTWDRQHTYSDNDPGDLQHIDFTHPYSEQLRNIVIHTAEQHGIDLVGKATYAATQGPRLETAAEIKRLEKDGCDIVGMTGMPEASLARELNMEYVSLSLVVNHAAGQSDELITTAIIENNLQQCKIRLEALLEKLLPNLN